jgi:hypothetical protein
MINFPRSTLSELKNETARQQSQLLAAYATAIGQPLPEEATKADPNLSVQEYQNALEKVQQSKLNQERLIRFGIAALVFLLFILIIWRLKPKGWLNLVLGAIMFSVLFHVSYITFGQKLYSYSTVISPIQLVLINGIFTLISLAITLLLLTFQNWIVMDLKQNFIKILDLGLFIMVVTSLPLIAHILWNGLFATWILPDLALHYLALLSLIQVFFIGLGILFLSLAAGIILINRRRRTA